MFKWILHNSGKYLYAKHNSSIRADLKGNVYGGGVNFLDDEDYIEVNDSASITLGTSSFSIALWFNPGTQQDSFPSIIGKGDTGAGEWMLRIFSGFPSKISFYADAGACNAESSTTPITGSNDYCVVINHDTDLNTVVGYVNDELKFKDETASINLNDATSLRIGNADGDANRFYIGKVWEVYIWKGITLTAEEMTLLYSSKLRGIGQQIHPDNLVLYLPLDDQPIQTGINGLVFKDFSGNGNNGTGVDADGDSAVIPETVLSYPQDICYVDAYSVVASGNIKKICGIPWANVKKVSGIAKANIKKVAGISAQ